MTDKWQYWMIEAVQREGIAAHSEPSLYVEVYPADKTISASRVARDFNERYLTTYRTIKVAPIPAPRGWDVFDVLPEQIHLRETRRV